MKPYGLISDTHGHNWSAFATTLPSGVNSRLQIILDETLRAAQAVKAAGGKTLYHGGDLFHVRGNLAPSVLNPTLACYREILHNVDVVINAGNHDLESKEAADVSSAITAFREIGCKVVNAPTYGAFDDMVVIPWIPSIIELKQAIERVDPVDRKDCDLLLHAPIDGTIKGLPDHGLSPEYLKDLGYRRVFAGHYHHHYDHGGGVYSIGALTHQTWSDLRSKAGFLIVDDKDVKWHSTRAPQFVEIDGSTDKDDVPLIVDGNYVRVTITSSKSSDVELMRQFLMDSGALGVVVLSEKTSAGVTRTATSYKAGTTIEASINDFIKAQPHFSKPAELAVLCNNILSKVRAVA
jgi:DNA repair exonuclease SbcCD nuclease subunit